MIWNFACPDWQDRLRRRQSLVPELPLFQTRRDEAIKAFNKLRLPDVPGNPTMGEAAGEWFRDIVGAVFGSLDDAGVRHVSEVLALVPKKNNKTTGGAGIMLTALLVNKRPRATFLLVGPTQEVAEESFQQAVGMINTDPSGYLQTRFHIIEHKKTIRDRTNSARLKVKTFDTKIVTGSKPVGILLDELHEMSDFSYATRVIGQLRGGMIPFPESFLIIITTQSNRPPAGVFKSELRYARGVRDGSIPSGRLLPILYEFPEAVQRDRTKPWLDAEKRAELWPMVNPNMGLSITLERLISDFEDARHKGDDVLADWCSQHLNIEMGMAMHDDRWPGVDYWEGAGDPTLTLEALIERSEVLVFGVDGGGADDMLGLCVAGRERKTGRWLYWCKAWVDVKLLERRPEIAERLRDFERDGDLVLVDFPQVEVDRADDYLPPDLADLIDVLKRLDETGLLPDEACGGLDRAGMPMLVDALVAADFTTGENDTKRRIVSVPQGWQLNPAIVGLARKLRDGTVVHGDQALMQWCVGNAKQEQRANAVVITKQVAGKAKIDPFVAALNATMLLAKNPVASRSVVTADDILTVI